MLHLPWTTKYAFAIVLIHIIAFGSIYTQDTLVTTLYFDTDECLLLAAHKADLAASIEDQFSKDAISSIYIQGYADRRGTAAYNIKLSERRVNSISEYLRSSYSNRIAKVRSQAHGSSLAGDNLRYDRRVDVTFYTQPKLDIDYEKAVEIEDLATIESSLLKKGIHLKIKNLNFQPGRSKLLRSSIPQLKELEKLLKRYKKLCLRIEGHVCCSAQLQDDNDGRDVDNNSNNLSEARAKNIYNYLIKKGIQQDRLSYLGYGHSRPLIFPEQTEEDRSSNRRVEFLITKH